MGPLWPAGTRPANGLIDLGLVGMPRTEKSDNCNGCLEPNGPKREAVLLQVMVLSLQILSGREASWKGRVLYRYPGKSNAATLQMYSVPDAPQYQVRPGTGAALRDAQ